MSLFPHRLKRGGTLTIHLSSSAPRPAWVRNRIFVVRPDGNRALVSERIDPVLPMEMSEADYGLQEKMGAPFVATPILMAARYLQRDGEDPATFVRMLQRLRDSAHRYFTFPIAVDAPLGRYRLELESTMDGNTVGSGTAASDYFFVEELHLREIRGDRETREALVENPGPEPVPAKLCVETRGDFQSRWIELPPHTVTPVAFSGTAFLVFAASAETLPLSEAGDRFCLRNPGLSTLPKGPELVYVFSTEEKPERAYELDGVAARLWYGADGFVTRSTLRTPDAHAEYDELVRLGLLLERE